MRAAPRVVGGTILGTLAGLLMAVPAAVVADQFLFLRTVLGEWGFSLRGSQERALDSGREPRRV
jgi:hypothetical protein